MANQPIAPGTWGNISVRQLESGKWQAKTRFRRIDGSYQIAKASGTSPSAARRALEYTVSIRIKDRHSSAADLTPDSTVRELCERWIEEAELVQDLRATTRHEAIRLVRANIIPDLGHFKLRELRVSTVYEVYRRWHTATPSMSRNIKGVLRKVCSLGVRLDVLLFNPADELKNFKRPDAQIYAPNPIELDDLRESVTRFNNRPARMGPKPDALLLDVINVILATSARIGEALGIRVEDVDLASNPPTVTIAGQVVEGHGQPKHWSPVTKTDSGLRRIPVPDFVIPVLQARIERAVADRTQFLFHTKTGAPNGQQDVHRRLRAVREWAGIAEEMVPRAFRKSVATTIAQSDQGGMVAAARTLGHKEARVTEAHYAKRAVDAPDMRHLLERNAPGASRGSVHQTDVDE